MKPKLLLLCLTLFSYFFSYAQLHVEYVHTETDGIKTSDPIVKDKDIQIPKERTDLKSIIIKCRDLPAGEKLQITAVGESPKDYTTANAETSFAFLTDLLNKEVSIKHFNAAGTEVSTDAIKFRFIPEPNNNNGGGGNNNTAIQPSIDDYLLKNYSTLEATSFGYIDPTDKQRKIHIFFDYLGNSLLSTIPSGISNAQYIVHIIYPFSLADPNKVSYSIKQKSGSFSSALLFNNSNINTNGIFKTQSGEKYDGITERAFVLGTSTDDLTFDIVAATKDNQITKTVLETYTIKMSPVYHGSFDVGLIKTDLSNPTYSLVQDPNSTNHVVKQTDESPKGVVTVMASFYVSPIVLLESVFGKKKIPFYKLTGRSFLDDHKFYERFYPTIGVGISDKAFENIFYGINWEVARGLSIFGGWHYGKVKTFEMPNFQPGVTPVTNDQFEFYQNTKWKTSTAIGIKLDIMIVRNLFGTVAATQ